MLILSRQRDETIVVGGLEGGPVICRLSEEERRVLEMVSRQGKDGPLRDLAIRLLTEPPLRLEVMIVDVRGDKVRLGVTAPPGLSVHRGEIVKRIQSGIPMEPRP